MVKIILRYVLIFLLYFCSNAQNETKKWCFGVKAGLDFTTNAALTFTTAMTTSEGSSSIADSFGNLLFYTNGVSVWNKNHVLMANGNSLMGDISTTQSALIVKQPGSQTLYYIFTADNDGEVNGLRYSIVDMTLAAGLGSVTAKNIPLYTPTTEKLCGVRHCNGTDVWILSHKWNSDSFY
jgi:hypothetical protein